jgi:hypothetical protein
VEVCDRRYVFDAQPPSNSTTPLVFDADGRCPAFVVNPKIARAALVKQRADEVEYAQLVKDNVPVAPIYSGLDGGMNTVFLASFPDKIVSLAIVLPPGSGSELPQLPAIPWTDNDGSLANKFFGALLGSNPASQRHVSSTDLTMHGRAADPATTASSAAPTTRPAFPD